MSNFNIQETKARLLEAEKNIEKAKVTREDAIKQKTASETTLKISEAELEKLGVSPANAEAELAKLEAEIQKELEDIENNIPIDLLRALRRI